jgi:hypothetical protein
LLTAGAHMPEPSQVEAGVETSPLHEAAPQVIAVDG